MKLNESTKRNPWLSLRDNSFWRTNNSKECDVVWRNRYFRFVCLDDLLRAGIKFTEDAMVVNKTSSNSAEEGALTDWKTIVIIQTVFCLFPHSDIFTELSKASNMRFMQFRADDFYVLSISKLEKSVKKDLLHVPLAVRVMFSAPACWILFRTRRT